MPVVLDASVALTWILHNQNSAASEAIFEAVARDHALVPALWHFEVAGVLARHRAAGALSWQEIEFSLREIETLDIRIDRQLTPLVRLLQLSETYSLSGYDAAYLDLALRSGTPLATFDKGLRSGATLAGITLVSA